MVVHIGLGHPWKRLAARRGRIVSPPAAVAEVVEESTGVEAVEELAVAIRGQMPPVWRSSTVVHQAASSRRFRARISNRSVR